MKKKETIKLECLLYEHFFLKKGERVALEAQTFNLDKLPFIFWDKRVDLISVKKNVFTCVEIKVSKSDFKSKHGHNFTGNKNYYAVPPNLIEYAIENAPKHVGVISYTQDNQETRAYIYKNAKKIKSVINDTSKLTTYGRTMPENQEWLMFTALNSTVRRLLTEKLKEMENDS